MVRAPISIIIPSYNDAIYLHDCLGSISKNTILPQEIIIVDDGSEDDAAHDLAKSEEFAFLNIHFFKIQNIGPSGARNFGFKHSVSEFILFLDADDFLPSNIIGTYAENLSQLSDNYFGICGRMKNFGKVFNAQSYIVPEHQINADGLGRKNELQGQISCYVLRASFLKKLDGFDEKLAHYEDFDLILRLLKIGKLRTISNVVLHKRFHKNSQSNKDFQKSYLGTRKFLHHASIKNLFSAKEISFRLRENLLSYAKQLSFKLKIYQASIAIDEAFKFSKPASLKEWSAMILCRAFGAIYSLDFSTNPLPSKSSFTIAIVIPTFNDEDFLMETLASVFHQTVLPDELIIIDDGSDHPYVEKILNVFYNENVEIQVKRIKNAGPSHARNIGSKIADADFIHFLDSDDLMDRNALAWLHGQLKNFNFHSHWGIHAGISFVGLFAVKNYLPNVKLITDQKTLDNIGKEKTLEGLSSFLFSKKSFLDAGGFRESLSHNEDFDLILRLSLQQSVSILPKKVIQIRKRKGSLSNRSAKNSFEGVNKFLDVASQELLLTEKEILVRKKENRLTYAKNLFFQVKIQQSLQMFSDAFAYSAPNGIKEFIAWYASKIFNFFKPYFQGFFSK